MTFEKKNVKFIGANHVRTAGSDRVRAGRC